MVGYPCAVSKNIAKITTYYKRSVSPVVDSWKTGESVDLNNAKKLTQSMINGLVDMELFKWQHLRRWRHDYDPQRFVGLHA